VSRHLALVLPYVEHVRSWELMVHTLGNERNEIAVYSFPLGGLTGSGDHMRGVLFSTLRRGDLQLAELRGRRAP